MLRLMLCLGGAKMFQFQDNLFTKVKFELCADNRRIKSHSDLGIVLLLVHQEERLSVCVKDVEEWVLLKLSKSWRFKFKNSLCPREFIWIKLLFC